MSAAKAVYRLIDIVVEEVSLVDRAANKHRFLIVKRDEGEGVDDDMEDLTQDAGDEDEGTKDGGAEGEQPPPPQGGNTPAPAPLEVATKALASLTDAVERLSMIGASPEQVTAVVAELDGAARELAKTLGAEPSARSEPGGGGDDPFATVRATLTQVREMIAGAQPAPPAQPPEPAPAPAPAPAAKSGGSTPAAKGKLDQLLEQVGSLAKGLKEQGQQLGKRMAQLEKQVGVPNSTPAGERAGAREEQDEEGFWSLDLNRPVDRESVDKSVSFHDV